MNCFKIVILLSFLVSLWGTALGAEQITPDSTATRQSKNNTEIDYSKIKLPSVNVFLDAAESYAAVKYYDARVNEEEQQLKVSRKQWLKYLTIKGNYQYGTNSANLLQSEQSMPEQVYYYSRNVQNWYGAGVELSIPLNDLFSRKNQNSVIRARLAQTEYERERSLEDRKILILEAYNEVIKNLALLKVNAESVALYDAQMKISERDYVNGEIDIITLSLERGRRTEANIKYQQSRAALHNAVTILEMLTKIKIIAD